MIEKESPNFLMLFYSNLRLLQGYVYLTFRSSHRRCSLRKGVLRNFTKFTGKHLCQSLYFNKVAGLKTATLLKSRFWHRCFPVNFVKFLRTPFLSNTSGRLLLQLIFQLKTESITSSEQCVQKQQAEIGKKFSKS